MDEVVLVHGLWYRCWSMAWLKRRLQRAGYRVRCFGYPTLAQAPEQSARALADFCARSEANVVHLVGHSLGGLVILAMLGQGAYHPTGRLLLLGTPLAGSSVVRRIAAWPGGSRILGQAREFLAAGASATGASWACGMIAGTRGLGLGRLSGAKLGRGDGTVALQETRHAMVVARAELPVSHTGLLASAAVARQVIRYLSDGRFDPV